MFLPIWEVYCSILGLDLEIKDKNFNLEIKDKDTTFITSVLCCSQGTTYLNVQNNYRTDVEIFSLVWKLAVYFRFWWRLATSTTSGFVFDKSLTCKRKQSWKYMQAKYQTVLLTCSQGSYINWKRNDAAFLNCSPGSHIQTLPLKKEGSCSYALGLQKNYYNGIHMQNG